MRKGWFRVAFKALVGGVVALAVAVTAVAQDQDAASAEAAAPLEQSEIDPVGFGRELRSVEEEVNHLKERVFRSKATLQLLKELVTEGGSVGSRLNIWHVNHLGGAYTLESIQYFVDGRNIFGKVDPTGTLDTIREIKVYEQAIPAGAHVLRVQMVLRGKGYKVFSYLRNYQFRVQSSFNLNVSDGKLNLVRVIADSQGGLRNFAERPDIRFEPRVESLRE